MLNFLVNRNNEALEDDIVQKTRVADILRKHVKAVNEYIIKPAELTESQTDEVKKILLSFSSTLDEYVNKLEGGTEPLKNVGIVLYRYNLLATVLSKVRLNTLPDIEKAEIISELDDMVPKIEELLRYAQLNNFTDIDQLKQSLFRHVLAVMKDDINEDHLAAVSCNAMMIAYQLRNENNN